MAAATRIAPPAPAAASTSRRLLMRCRARVVACTKVCAGFGLCVLTAMLSAMLLYIVQLSPLLCLPFGLVHESLLP